MAIEITEKMYEVWRMHDNGASPELIAAILDGSIEAVRLVIQIREDAQRILYGDYEPLRQDSPIDPAARVSDADREGA